MKHHRNIDGMCLCDYRRAKRAARATMREIQVARRKYLALPRMAMAYALMRQIVRRRLITRANFNQWRNK